MANKRVIDLSTLSETVQEGQYILVDSSGGTGKMDLKKIVDDSTETLADQVEQNTQDIENLSGDLETLEGRVDDAEEAITGKADDDGIYPELYAGNLISDKMQTDKVPYLFRKTAGELGSDRIGERCYETIIGASVGRNQLARITTNTINGVTFTANDNGSVTISGTATANATLIFNSSMLYNHIILYDGFKNGSASTYFIGNSIRGVVQTTTPTLYKVTSQGTVYNYISVTNGASITTPLTIFAQMIDLTAEFGSSIADYIYSLESATAGSGIAKLRSWGFLRGYQAYNAGSIESVEVTGKVVRGFNQWDEEWEVGGYADATGSPWNTSDRIRSKTADYIAVIPNMDYYFRSTSSFDVYWYDANKAYIGHNAYTGNTVHTSPNNARYMRFATYANYGATYNHDICINLSSDRNGEYEAYTSQTYALGSDKLRGIFKLDANNNLYADGDVKTSDGAITRKYSIDTIRWGDYLAEYAPTGNAYKRRTFQLTKTPVNGDGHSLILNGNKYNQGTPSTEAYYYVYDYLYVWMPAETSDDYETSIVYELATPTTEQGAPFTSPQVCYPDGTEEYVTSNGVPVGHSTEYPYDLKGLVEGLIDVPDVPSASGTYALKATRSASGVAYNWVTG